jgi:hypothetical protein
MDRDRPDVLGDDDEQGDDEQWSEPAFPGLARAVLAPEALALASVVLATVSLLGLGLLNGMPYLPLSFDQGPPQGSDLLAPALLGAGLALLPLVFGTWALRRLPEDSPSRTTAGAGVLLAGVSVVLRLVIAVRAGADDSMPFVQF